MKKIIFVVLANLLLLLGCDPDVGDGKYEVHHSRIVKLDGDVIDRSMTQEEIILKYVEGAEKFEHFIRQAHQEEQRIEWLVLETIDGETVIPLNAEIRENILAWHERTGHMVFTQEEIQTFLRILQNAIEHEMLNEPLDPDECYDDCYEIEYAVCQQDEALGGALGGTAGAIVGGSFGAIGGPSGAAVGGLFGWYMGQDAACQIPTALGCSLVCDPPPSGGNQCGADAFCSLLQCPEGFSGNGSCYVGGSLDPMVGTCCAPDPDPYVDSVLPRYSQNRS